MFFHQNSTGWRDIRTARETISVLERRPKVADVAARAGVSTATVDRVINRRGGVHQKTAARVEEAIRAIVGHARPGPTVDPALRFDAVLSGERGGGTKALADGFAQVAEETGANVEISFVETMNPEALADRLRTCAQRGSSGVAVQVLDHALVREAVAELARAGIPVVTVLTDIAGVDHLGYFGLDNRAAGRTAGLLMTRFCRTAGKLAVVWGGQLYRSHEERESGFRSVLRAERPDLQSVELITGNDNPEMTRERVREALATQRDLVGIYCVGGGIAAAADAIEQAGLAPQVVLIGHNYNPETKPYLLSGTIHALVHQDMGRIAADALACLSARKLAIARIPIEIITRENTMYR
jgi:LacI family transcriptional regulator